MKRLIALIGGSIAAVAAFEHALAQNAMPTWAPVEIYSCNFQPGAGMADLDRVIARWNQWSDQNGHDDYTAFVLTPHFTSAEFEYDIGWLGVWRDGPSLAAEQQWLTDGAAINEDFGEVVDCPQHQAMAIAEIRDIGPVPEGSIVPVEFTNCTIHEGRIGPEAMAAAAEWVSYMAEHGSQAGHWLLRPGPGEIPGATYSFKWATAYPSWGAAGQDFEVLFNGGGDRVLGDLTERVFTCDHSRFYNTRLVREMAE